MRKPLLLILLIMTLMLCSCYKTISSPFPSETNPTQWTVLFATEQSLETESHIVYNGSTQDYLLPLEEYSWERKYDPEFIMIHFSSAVVNHPDDPYNIQYIRDTFVEYNVSTHYIIERDGTIHCYIPEDCVAWHAGKGEWKDDPRYTNNMNQYAIGIELVTIGSEKDMEMYMTDDEYERLDDSLKGYTQEQYDALKLLVEDLCERYGIPMDREHVIGHEEYSESKTDPGELFDWSKIVGVG